MILSPFILLILHMLILALSGRSVNFTTITLTPYTVEHEWNQVEKVLEGQPISELIFEKNFICQEGLSRILQAPGVKGLKSMQFKNDFFQYLSQSAITSNLINLTLNQVNIQSSDLRYFPTQKQYALERLSLEKNYISKEGLEYLAKLNLSKLISFNFYDNSLSSDAAVDAFLKLPIKQLTEINLGATGVQEEGLLRIIRALDLTKLTSLNISKNYFEPTFYQKLCNINFPALQQLDISDLLIDERSVLYLEKMKFPKLKTLSIGQNQIFANSTSSAAYSFLNKNNYPQLINLIIKLTIFHKSFLTYFTTEFKSTLFHKLSFTGKNYQSNIFHHFQEFNFSQLKSLHIPDGATNPSSVAAFFDAHSFPVLEEINFYGAKTHCGAILHKILEKKWPHLRILILGMIGKIDFSLLQKQTLDVKFPKIQAIYIIVKGLTPSQIQTIIQNLVLTSKNMIELQIELSNTARAIDHILKSNVNLSNPVYLCFNYVEKNEGPTPQKFVVSALVALLSPLSKPSIYLLKIKSFMEELFLTSHIEEDKKSDYFNDYIQKKLNEMSEKVRFDQIKYIEDGKNLPYLKGILSSIKKTNSKCLLPKFEKLQILQINESSFKQINECEFPNLDTLRISFENQTTIFNNVGSFLPQNMRILSVLIIDNMLMIPKQRIIEFFQHQKFVSLNFLIIANSDFRSDDIRTVLNTTKNLRRLRGLSVFQTWITDVNFVSDFNMVLSSLDLTAEPVGMFLQQLCNVNFEFMKIIRLAGDMINNQKLIDFVKKLTKDNKNPFPKLNDLNIFKNEIEDSGTELFLNLPLPMMKDLIFAGNINPNIVNIMFNAPTLRRLRSFVLFQNDQDSIDPNLNPKKSRQIKLISFETAELAQTDLFALSKLQYTSLQSLTIQISKYFDCKSLAHILKIGVNANKILIAIKQSNDHPNSNCLAGMERTMKNLVDFSFVSENSLYSNFRNVFDLLIFGQSVKKLIIVGVYPSEQSMNRFGSQIDLDGLQVLLLPKNDISDAMLHGIFNQQLRQLKILQMSGNARITSQSLKLMRNRSYPQLNLISFENTGIDDAGVEILTTCQFPSLRTISLQNTQITKKSLQLLSNLKSPNLNKLDVSNNNLSLEDLKYFSPKNYPYFKQISVFPHIKHTQRNILLEMYNLNRKSPNIVKISSDFTYEQSIVEEDAVGFDGEILQ